jgi:uncharacterized protein
MGEDSLLCKDEFMSLSRRRLISAGAVGLAFAGMARYATGQGAPPPTAEGIEADAYRSEVTGYGPLGRDPAGVFDLPRGFSYRMVSRFGDAMDDGLVVPGKFDGMGCFGIDADRVALVRNHELKWPDGDRGPFGPGRINAGKVDRALIYDHTDTGLPLVGGTTTLVYHLRTGRLERQHLSLVGTSTNCSGGITPWGSWLSCEETTETAGLEVMKDHGYVFEVPHDHAGLVSPAPLKALGRFRHEAACVDPGTGIIYMTEDESDGQGLFYRFLPETPGQLHRGGRLQALGFEGGGDPRNWESASFWSPGERRKAVWIDLDGADNPYGDLRYRGQDKGAAWFARGEGVFYAPDAVYISCTSGGPSKLGQIMRYRPSDQTIELFLQPDDPAKLEMNDNIAVAPWGHLFVCEDKADGVNYLRAVTPEGRLYTVGRNAAVAGGDVGMNSELAGACFSPDGSTLFINIYRPGMTLAITGPWSSVQV